LVAGLPGRDILGLWLILRDILVLLGGCLLVGGIFSRFGQSPIVGYLLAGMALGGPGSLNLVQTAHEIEAIAELGVALLLFSLGLEFSVVRLKDLGWKPLLGGMGQIGTTILAAFLATRALGFTFPQAVAFGAMVSLSSTAVVLRILSERSEMDTPHGRQSLGVLLTQDMAVVPLALLMTILGGEGSFSEVAGNVVKLFALAILLIIVLFLVTRVAVLALGQLTLLHNRELTVVFAGVMGVGASWLSQTAGISPALGAFVAGMMLGSSDFSTQIRADIAPLQALLLTLFFGAVGMVADPIWIFRNAHIVALAVFATILIKLIIVWGIFRLLGHAHRVAAATGVCLSQIGEFAFVLGVIGRQSEVVTDEIYVLVISMAIVSFFLSALLVPRAAQLGNLVVRWMKLDSGLGAQQIGRAMPEIAIIGFGPAGRRAASPLVDSSFCVLVIDLNHQSVREAKKLGFVGEIGDATQLDVLNHARLSACHVVVITIPHQHSALTILELVRQVAPQARVLVRSRYDAHMQAYLDAGAYFVCGDESSVGERLATSLTESLPDRSSLEAERDASRQAEGSH